LLTYAGRRLLAIVPVVLVVSLTTFGLLHVVAGSAVPGLALNAHLTKEGIAQIRANLGLNQPLYRQYASWLRHVLTLNFGNSLVYGTRVSTLILGHLGATVELVATAILLGLCIGIPLGVAQATRSRSRFDRVASFATAVGYATPQFWLGLVGVLLFSVYFSQWGLPSLPATGDQTPFDGSIGDRLAHLVLPASVLAVAYVATWSRFIRTSLLEVLASDYVRTARAKGMSQKRVVYVHALRNAVLPVVTLIALELPALVGGAAVVEVVFGWPGIGQLAYNSTINYDYPTVMGITIFAALLVVLSNLVADLVYGVANPRIRYR
jgi:peptide/nickel transport system permease protein